MEVHQTSIQYLKCMNCSKFLGKGCLICDLGHPCCASCGRPGEKCATCDKYVSGSRPADTLHPNLELEYITKKVFSRCKNARCNRLIPLFVYEEHLAECNDLGSVVSCTVGCGVVDKSIAEHLIFEHGYKAEDISQGVLFIYPTCDNWLNCNWKEWIVNYSENTSILVCPKVENKIFSLRIYNLCAHESRFKVKVKKGWNCSTFTIKLPFYDEQTVPINNSKVPVFWNCEVNTMKKSFIETDCEGKSYLKVILKEII